MKIKPSTNPSQSSGVTSTTTISYTTQTPAVTLKGSDVIIMIIKRDYKSSLGDKEGKKFQDFPTEVQKKVNTALKNLKGFHSLLVKKIIQANSVIYQLKIFVQRDSNIKEKMMTTFSKNLTGVLTETSGNTQPSSHATALTTLSPPSITKVDSVNSLKISTQTIPTKSQSIGVSLSSISAVGSQTSGTLPTSQSSPISPFLLFVASHTTQTLSQASTFTSVSPSSFTDVDPVSSFQFSTPTTATQSQSYAVSLSSILELGSPTSGALTTSQLSPVSPSLRSAAADTIQTSWQATVSRVTVTIANEVYTEEFADNTSVQFKKLSKELIAILTDIFKTKVPGFRRVEIINFRRGSVICVFQVITEKSKASVDKIEDVLTEASKNGKAGKYTFKTFKDVNVEQETAEATKQLSTGIASIRSETSSKTKTSQILRLSTRASRSFRMDLYVTSSSLFSTTAPISKSPQPTSVSTTSATSFKTQTEPSPSQSSGVTPTTTISPTTPKPEVSLKRFNVTMTITNRDYNSSLGDKESQQFQNLAAEVRDNVKNALNDSKGFISSEVEKFLEANSVTCKLKTVVLEDSDITKETIKVSLENSSGSLKLTDVTVVDTEMPTTMVVTDKKRLPNPLRKR